MVNQHTLEIIAAACGQGRMHDFRLFKKDYAGMAAHVRGHVIGRSKIFRILSERYRNRRKRFCLRFDLVAAIYSFESEARS